MGALLDRWRRRLRERPAVLDAAIATGLLVAVLVGLSGQVASAGFRPADAAAYLIAIAGVLPYYARRQAPLLVLLIAMVPVLALVLLDYSVSALGAGLFLLCYTVAAWCDRRSLVVAIVAAIALLAAVTLSSDRMRAAELVSNTVLIGASFVLGAAMQERRRHAGWVEERARLLERDRHLLAERAVAQERLRIAQELHDVVAHSLGVIAVQAGVGAHVIGSDPDEAKAALLAIADTSRGSLAEIRGILCALRSGDAGGDGLHPTPGLAGLDGLAAEMTAAGVPVRLDVVGARDALPAGVERAAYRVVQESLTNVLAHAPGAHAEVRVDCRPDAVEVLVRDDGARTGPPAAAADRADRAGLGLVGMRERVHAFGGSFAAGPRQPAGFEVHAVFPRVGRRVPGELP